MNAPPRRLRTWSAFGEIRRKPSEYEIVTHDLNYMAREGRHASLEMNPSGPMNMWFLTYRDKSPLQCDDWNGYRDPDELTYRRYVTVQDEAEVVVHGVLDDYDEAGHDASLAPEWLDALSTVLTPMRYPLHGLQQIQAYLGVMAPSSYVTNAAAFAAADMLRAVNVIAYRTRQLQIEHPDRMFATGERDLWQEHPAWQGARKALETALAAYDFGEALTAANLVLWPTLESVLYQSLGQVARNNGDDLTWLLLTNLAHDAERQRRWSCSLASFAVEQRPGNAQAFERWARRWAPRADEALDALAGYIAGLPNDIDAATITSEAVSARETVLVSTGVPVAV